MFTFVVMIAKGLMSNPKTLSIALILLVREFCESRILIKILIKKLPDPQEGSRSLTQIHRSRLTLHLQDVTE